jgi:hypothetical protein
MEQEMKHAKNGRDFHYTPEELQDIIQNNFGDLEDDNNIQEIDLTDELRDLEAEERNAWLENNSDAILNVTNLFDLHVIEENEQNENDLLDDDIYENGDAAVWDPHAVLQQVDNE